MTLGYGQPARFQLLGRFEVSVGGRAVQVGGPTAQAVLVALLRRPGQPLLAGQVVAAVWGQPGAVTDDSLYHYIGKLRKALAPLGVRIDSCWPGYRLVLPGGAVVDAVRFEELVGSAESLRESEPEQAVHRLRAALDLWQPEAALAGLAMPGTRAIAARLDDLRLTAAEQLAELELDSGHPDQVLARFPALAAAHQDRSRLTAALMRALHATGRAGEALSVYRRAEQFARRQGREPPETIRRAQQEVLSDQAPQPAAGPAAATPYQLPADTSYFTGRAAELARLRGLWPDDGSMPAALVVSAVDGMAGIGKTALAVHAAHELADRFPDGNLFIDLHGFTPRTRPTPPEKALDSLLRGLGVTGQQIPRDLAARAALYRSRLARRRMLIVLDNAHDEAQVRPLLPGTTSCLVIVTSRRRLAGLDDASHLTLDTLAPQEAAELFRAVASDRATGSHQVVEAIVRTCGELPLAIRIAAARLRTSRAMSPATLLRFLRKDREDQGLASLDDGERSVAAAFRVSYHHLAPGQRHAFRLLGVHPGPTFDAYAAAALLESTLDQARHLLEALEQVNLISQPTQGRYHFHDLLRAYATTSLAADAAVPDQRQALRRLLDHYSHTASLAMDTLYPYEAPYRPRIAAPAAPAPPLPGDPVRAAAWLHEEVPNLLAAASHAAANGHPEHVLHLSATLARHLRTRARYADSHTLHTQALEIARGAGDQLGEMTALISLGRTEGVAGNHSRATDHYQRALAAARQAGHPHGETGALNGLGHVAYLTGHDGAALDHFHRALRLARVSGNLIGEIDARWGLGQVHRRAGRRQQAAEEYTTALRLAREIDHRGGEVRGLIGLGHIHRQRGSYPQATAHQRQALAIAVRIGDASGEVYALCGLGHAFGTLGRYDLAIADYGRAFDRANDINDRNGQYEALHGLGHTLRRAGRPDRAMTRHQEALGLAHTLGQPHDEARAHDGLAHAHRDLGHPNRARTHWHRALAILHDIGAPDTGNIHAHLNRLAEGA